MYSSSLRTHAWFVLLGVCFTLTAISLPSAASAQSTSEPTYERYTTIRDGSVRRSNHFCRTYRNRGIEPLPEYCEPTTPSPEPEPEPEPEAPTLTLSAAPLTLLAGETTTLTWNAGKADTCVASGDWIGTFDESGSVFITLAQTATFTLTCTGAGGAVMDTVTVTVSAPPEEPEEPEEPTEPALDHLLISEVHYDLANDGSQGSETGGANEWVELYNPTNNPVDLLNWSIGDGSSNDTITDTTLVMDPGSFLIITNATSTAQFWELADVSVVFLQSSISGGLSNTGDYVALFDETATVVDAVSYGSNTTAFDPAAVDVDAGSSLQRTDLSVDTDSAADWADLGVPTPGTAPTL